MKTSLFTIILIFFSLSICFAQKADPILDSLKIELEKATDAKQKVTALINITKRLNRTRSIEMAQTYIDRALIMAEQEKDKLLIANVLIEKAKILSAKGKNKEGEKIFNYYQNRNFGSASARHSC